MHAAVVQSYSSIPVPMREAGVQEGGQSAAETHWDLHEREVQRGMKGDHSWLHRSQLP